MGDVIKDTAIINIRLFTILGNTNTPADLIVSYYTYDLVIVKDILGSNTRASFIVSLKQLRIFVSSPVTPTD
ncbi:hypothetical protein C0J52_23432 [Blattella germanica]|nr:hypothetical protein C0J52_23432 [Blattella germanica]